MLYDHTGKSYNDINALSEHWGISDETLRRKLYRNDLEKLSEEPKIADTNKNTFPYLHKLNSKLNQYSHSDTIPFVTDTSSSVHDHFGCIFTSTEEMYRYWGIKA